MPKRYHSIQSFIQSFDTIIRYNTSIQSFHTVIIGRLRSDQAEGNGLNKLNNDGLCAELDHPKYKMNGMNP